MVVEVIVVATVEIAERQHFCEYREHQLAAEQLYLAPLASSSMSMNGIATNNILPQLLTLPSYVYVDTDYACSCQNPLVSKRKINCFSK